MLSMKHLGIRLIWLCFSCLFATPNFGQDGFRWNLDLSDDHFLSDVIHIQGTGHFFIGTKFDPQGRDQGFIIHLDRNGQIKWSKIVSNGDLGTSFVKIKRMESNLLIGGTIFGTQLEGRNGLIVSVDLDGKINWAKTIGTNNVETFRDLYLDGGIGIVMDIADNITQTDWLVGILDLNGTLQNSLQLKLSAHESANFIGNKSAHGRWIAGTTQSLSENSDILITHLDTNNQISWNRWIDLPHQQSFENGVIDEDGSFYGSSTDDDPMNPGSLIFRISLEGNLVWIKRLPFFIYGQVSIHANEVHLIDRSMCRTRFNKSDGEWLGGTCFWKIGNETSRSSFADNIGITIVGYVDQNERRFPHVIWSPSTSLVCDIRDRMIEVKNVENVKVSSVDFMSADGNLQVKSTELELVDLTIAFTNECPTSRVKDNAFSGFKIFPNPTSDYLHLQFDDHQVAPRLEVINTQGFTLYRQNKVRSGSKVDVSEIPQGYYFIKIHQKGHFLVKKWVKL